MGAFVVKQKAILQEFNYNNEPFKFDSAKTKTFTDVDKVINSNLTNNNIQQTRGTRYWALLPFALSAQFDYNFENNFYLNVTTVNTFKIQYQTRRIDVIALTPRYERKRFEINLPISLVDYRYPQVGLAFRFGNNLIIGSERIDSFFGKIRDVYGADLYFHLKLAFYRTCKSTKKRYKMGRRPNCPAYT